MLTPSCPKPPAQPRTPTSRGGSWPATRRPKRSCSAGWRPACGSTAFGTCRRVVAGWRRGEQRRREILERHGQELAPAAAAGPTLDLDRLTGCLQALSARERTVAVLTFYAERSADDIAGELSLSAGNVRVVRHRALARLRACMEGDA